MMYEEGEAKQTSKQNVWNGKASDVRSSTSEVEMLDDYSFLDWSKAERGKYVKRYAAGSNLVVIASQAAPENE